MILDVAILIGFVIWLIIYLINKKAVKWLPYLGMIFITPIYNYLDSRIFVDIFGCGCVPISQTNRFNIDFNANDLRMVAYNIIAILMFILGLFISKKFENKKSKIAYNICVLIFNLIIAYKIYTTYVWL